MPPTPAPESGEHQPPARRTRTAEIIDAGTGAIDRVGRLSPQQAQTAVMIAMTLFVCGTCGYLIYAAERSKNEVVGMMLRSVESEGERNRLSQEARHDKMIQMQREEFARNRDLFAVESKANREAMADLTKINVAAYQKLTVEIAKLESALAELRRKLPPCGCGCSVAPMPRIVFTGPPSPSSP